MASRRLQDTSMTEDEAIERAIEASLDEAPIDFGKIFTEGGLRFTDVKGDGSCFFRTISVILTGKDTEPAVIYQVYLDALKNSRNKICFSAEAHSDYLAGGEDPFRQKKGWTLDPLVDDESGDARNIDIVLPWQHAEFIEDHMDGGKRYYWAHLYDVMAVSEIFGLTKHGFQGKCLLHDQGREWNPQIEFEVFLPTGNLEQVTYAANIKIAKALASPKPYFILCNNTNKGIGVHYTVAYNDAAYRAQQDPNDWIKMFPTGLLRVESGEIHVNSGYTPKMEEASIIQNDVSQHDDMQRKVEIYERALRDRGIVLPDELADETRSVVFGSSRQEYGPPPAQSRDQPNAQELDAAIRLSLQPSSRPQAGGGTKPPPVPQPRSRPQPPPVPQPRSRPRRKVGRKSGREPNSLSPPRVAPRPRPRRSAPVIKRYDDVRQIQESLKAKLKQFNTDISAIESEYAAHQSLMYTLDTSTWPEDEKKATTLRQEIIEGLYEIRKRASIHS